MSKKEKDSKKKDEKLEKDIDNKRELIKWSQMPSFDAMVYVLSLAEHNIFEFDKHGVMSVRHLVMLLNTYRNKKTIMALVNNKKKAYASAKEESTNRRAANGNK